MKFNLLISAIAVCASFVLLSCSDNAPTSAQGEPLAKRAHNITWTLGGTVATAVAAPDDMDYCDGTGQHVTKLTSGDGYELSHLGLSSGEVYSCVTDGASFGTGQIYSQHGVIRAANGDEVYVTIWGDFQPLPVYPPTLGHSGHYLITGGTGRFDDAEGEGTYTGVHVLGPNYQNGTFEFDLTGTLEY